MAQAPASDNGKKKRTRSPSVAKPAFFIIQVLDEQGQPMQFSKKRIKLVSIERDAEQAVMLTDDEEGKHPHAFWIRGIVPVAKPQRTTATA